MAHKVISRCAVVRKACDTDAGTNRDLMAFDQKRLRQGADHARGQRLGTVAVRDQQGELVATQTCQQVVVALFAAQALRDQTQQRIAHRMAERFVYGSETVEVDQQHGLTCFGGRAVDRLPQHLIEVAAVAQSG